MARNKNYKVRLGEPEHVVTVERAREVLKNKMLFKPASGNNDIDQSMIFLNEDVSADGDGKMTYTMASFRDEYGLLAEGPNQAADMLANEALSRLEGNTNQFNKFTVESIGIMDKDMMKTLIKSGSDVVLADKIDDAINMLPKSNGKTFTTVQMLRTEEHMLDEAQFAEACNYASNARIPSSWYDYEKSGLDIVKRVVEYNDLDETAERNNHGIGRIEVDGNTHDRTYYEMPTVKPRGLDDLNRFIEIADTPFTRMTDAQQEAVVNLYADQPEALDELIEAQHSVDVQDKITDSVDLSAGLEDLSDLADDTLTN